MATDKKQFGELYAEWLQAHAQVWTVYGQPDGGDPTDKQSNAEYNYFDAAIAAPVKFTHELERKIYMAMLSYGNANLPDHVLDLLSTIIKDLQSISDNTMPRRDR